MPEATSNLHRDAQCREDDVDASSQLWDDAPAQEIAKPLPVEFPSKGQLGCGVSTSLLLHPATNIRRTREADALPEHEPVYLADATNSVSGAKSCCQKR